MKCPKCGTYGKLESVNGMVPISEDLISCKVCFHKLTQKEKNYLEAQVVEQRLFGTGQSRYCSSFQGYR